MYHWESLPHMTVELHVCVFHLLRFPVLSCLESISDFQDLLAINIEPFDGSQNLLFISFSAPPPFQPQASYLELEIYELL